MQSEIQAALIAAGDMFHGGRAAALADEWADEFSADEVTDWIHAGCWCPSTAADLRDAGFRPGRDHLRFAIGDAGDAMYSLCNGDAIMFDVIW